LKASTDENDLVLDPFNGSGTTGVSCIKNKRKYIGAELDKSFCTLSKKRFDNEFIELKSRLF
jgi:site-specific DNA-methyltransferase (adenine-specific)